jgi:MerR family transcriptional regulator, thiopeptide resistance regulator
MVVPMAIGNELPVGPGYKVGELATATGLTVRTLHHYEEIGLLVASQRTPAGHRLYDDTDVERLYRICLLRRLGLPLAEIAHALDDPEWNIKAALLAHLAEVERQLEVGARLRSRLARLASTMDHTEDPPTQDLLALLEEMTMLDTNIQRRISILVYKDIEAAYDFLTRVFGLGPGELTRDDTGRVVHGEIQAGDGVIWLHPETEEFMLKSPQTVGASTAMVAVLVEDVDAHFRYAAERGARIRYEPVDQAYGYREYGALDNEGSLWSFMKPLD